MINRPIQGAGRLRPICGAIAGTVLMLMTITQAGGQTGDSKEPISADNEIVIVTQAVASALPGNSNPSAVIPVKFAAAGIPPPNPKVRNGDFQLSSTAAFPYSRSAISNMQRQLAGVLRYQDPLGRFLSLAFEADYRMSPEGAIVINAAAVRQAAVPFPVILIQFIPKDKVTGALLASRSFQKLLEHVRKYNAINHYTQKTMQSKKDYYVFAFDMDRLEPDAKINLVFGDRLEGSNGAIKNAVTFQDEGWHVAYAPATFAADGDPPVFFKALYTPGGSIPVLQRKTVVAGVFTKSKDFVLVKEVHVVPFYSDSPEPLMFIVPVDALRGQSTTSSQTYEELLQFVAEHAVSPIKPASISLPEKDYVIFVFFLDQISPTASLSVKISDEGSSVYGYGDDTRYLNFGGWRVAALPGRFALPGSQASPPLYVKAVYTSGEEAGLMWHQQLVGLYHLSGATSLR